MLRSVSIQIPPEKVKQIKLRMVELDTTLKSYLLSLINKDLEQAKKEEE